MENFLPVSYTHLTEIYVLGGMVLMIPVQATVRTLGCSGVPQETITGGSGAINAPPFHFVFFIKAPICHVMTISFKRG